VALALLAVGGLLAVLVVAPAPAAATGPLPTVMRGSRANHVKTIQYLLSHHGADLEIDGDFGEQTEQKVLAFQQDNDLTVDGEVGPQTWEALFVTVERDDQGDAVRAVQTLLLAQRVQMVISRASGFVQCGGNDTSCGGHAALEAYERELDNGSFEEQTEKKVRTFRGAKRLVVDGSVGPQTWAALVVEGMVR